jgi:hypothetical protein
MPLIPEEDYITFSSAIQDPNATDEQKKGFAVVMDKYRTQQQSLNLPITPKLDSGEYQVEQDNNNKLKQTFSGVKNIPIPEGAKDYYPDEDSRLKFANKQFLESINKTPISGDDYDTFKNDFVNKNKIEDNSELTVYNRIQKSLQDESFISDKIRKTRQDAMKGFVDLKDYSTSLKDVQDKEGHDAVYVPEFADSYNVMKNTINLYKDKIDSFTSAMTNRMTTGESPKDTQTIKDFSDTLKDMPDDHRLMTLLYLRKDAERKGIKHAELFNNVANEFADSAGRVFSQGFAGASSMRIEHALASVDSKGKVTTEIPKIDTPEQAKAYLSEQIMDQFQTEGVTSGGSIFFSKGNVRPLTSEESTLINEEKVQYQKGLDISREIRNVGQSLDPIRDNWKGIMASTAGGSAALLGTAAIPGGVLVSQQLYSGKNYDELRTQYPDMSIQNAALIGGIAGTFEAALDGLNVKFLTKMPFIKGMLRPGISIGTKLLQGTGAATMSYAFENTIEGVQDLSKPITQSMLSGLKQDIPGVDWDTTLGTWFKERPNVAIGMIPLTLIGFASQTGTQIYSDKALIQKLSDPAMLRNYGISEENRALVAELVAKKDAQGLRDIIGGVINNRDITMSERLAHESSNDNSVNTIDADTIITHATDLGIVPKYSFNSDTNKYDASIDGIKLASLNSDEVATHREQYITDQVNKSANTTNDFINDKPTNAEHVSTDASSIVDKNNILSRINGLDINSVNAINKVFGNSVNQRDVIAKMAHEILVNKTNPSNVLNQYINGIYRNLPTDVQSTLGNNAIEGKNQLKSIILNRPSNIATNSVEKTAFKGVSPNDATITAEQKSAITTIQNRVNSKGGKAKILVSYPSNEFQTDTGIEKLGALQTISKQFEKLFNINTLFFQTSDNSATGVSGMYDKDSNTIFVNSQSKTPFLFLMGHEFGHSIEATNPELFQKLKDVIFSIIPENKRDAYYKVLDKSSTSYNSQEKKESELVNDFLGNRMLSEDFLNTLLDTDKSLFKTFIEAIKKYTSILKDKILGNRDISPYVEGNINQVDKMISSILKDLNSDKTVTSVRGFSSFFETDNGTTQKQIAHLTNRMRDSFNAAAKLATEKDKSVENMTKEEAAATIAEKMSPLTPEAFQSAVKDATDALPSTPDNTFSASTYPQVEQTLPDGETVMVDDVSEENNQQYNKNYNDTVTNFKNYRKSLHVIASKLKTALTTGILSDSTMANAIAVNKTNLTLDQVNNLSNEKKNDMIQTAFNSIDKDLVNNYKDSIANYIEFHKGLRDTQIQKNLKILNAVHAAMTSTNPMGDAANLLKNLYTENGIPNTKDGNFADNLMKYNAFRYLGNIGDKTSEQYRQLASFFENYDPSQHTFTEELEHVLKTATAELDENKDLDTKAANNKAAVQKTRKYFKSLREYIVDTKKTITSFGENHLTFASLLELAFPNASAKNIHTRIQELQAIENKTAEQQKELTTLVKQVSGKALTPTMQKISDDINNASLKVQMENIDTENTLIDSVGSIVGIKHNTGRVFKVKQAIYDMLTNNKGFDVSINGENYRFSTGYASYILNIADQKIYDKVLNDKGITPDVIKTIQDKITKDYPHVESLRQTLRKEIAKENKKSQDENTRVFGFVMPTPNKNFYPVRFKNRNIAVITPYDVQYQSGTINNTFDPLVDYSTEELDLDLSEQGDNLISMFNSHMAQSIYKRNLLAPVLAAKAVLTDKHVSDKLENSFGKSYKELLFKQLNAFETNGIRSNFLDFITTNRIRKMLTNVARGAMGFKLSTMLVNFTSSLNATMDASIPAGQIMGSYLKVMTHWGTIIDAKNSVHIQDRIKMGSNSLVAMSKADTFAEKPGYLKEAAHMSLQPMSYFDAMGGSIAAAAAFDAHYTMAENAGVTDKNELNEIATEGMARTINKTFQPLVLSGKSSFEMQSNPILKLFTMFMSEQRKTLGLELAVVKTKGVFHGDFWRMFAANHILLGIASYVLRGGVKDLLSPEEDDDKIWDKSRLLTDILLGPLGATFIAGTILEEAAYKIHNLIIDAAELDDKKIPIFGDTNSLVQAGQQASSIVKLPEALEKIFDGTSDEKTMKDIEKSIKGISTLSGSTSLGGVTTIANILKQMSDMKDAQTKE